MKTLLILILVVACGKDPSKKSSSGVQAIIAPTQAYCSGVTRQDCFQRCHDEEVICQQDAALETDPSLRNGKQHDCGVRENACVTMVNGLPVTGTIIP